MLGILPLDAAPLSTLPAPTGGPPIPTTAAPYTTFLAELSFSSPSPLTLRLAEYYVPPIYTGDEWLALVLAWGELAETVDGSPGSSELTLTNTAPIAGKPRFSDLIRTPTNTTGTYELVGAQVRLRRLSRGASLPTTLGVLVVEDAAEGDDRVVRLRLRDASLRLEHQAPLTAISRTNFPASPRDLAESVIPIPFGTLSGVPALPVVAGTHGKLATAV